MNKIFDFHFAHIYQLYIQKVNKKSHTKDEVNQIISWLTGYDNEQLNVLTKSDITLKDFFDKAPQINPNSKLIKGSICGIRVEDIEDPMLQKIRYLDKLIDELAKGKSMDKILRK